MIDPSKVTGGKVSFYWRVVSKDAGRRGRGGRRRKKDDKKNDKDKKPEYAYEDINTVPLPAGPDGPMRISRSFTVRAGDYDVYRRRQGADAGQGAEERAAAEGLADQADGRRCRISGTASSTPAR